MEFLRFNQWNRWKTQQETGGWIYHYLAKRYAKVLWHPFIQNLHESLIHWRPSSKNLVLLGPSGGYCLSNSFLRTFHSRTAIELDKSAPYFFRRQHPGLRTSWLRKDYFFLANGNWNPLGPAELLEDFPYHSFLFCNLLGQLSRHHERPGYGDWKKSFREVFRDKSFFSFHDLLSSSQGPLITTKIQVPAHGYSANLAKIQENFLARFQGVSTLRNSNSVTLIDHLTHEFFTASPRLWVPWSITPRQHHIIEFAHNDVDQ
jgi:hypothetical protein